MSEAQALRPKPDLFIQVVNATAHKIDVCTVDLKVCTSVLPGAMSVDAKATANSAIVSIAPWIADTVVKGCGKTIPLQTLVAAPVAVKDGKTVTYRLTISDESYQHACALKPSKK